MAGTEKRQRDKVLHLRVSAEEQAAIAGAADRAGLSIGSYVRQRLLDDGPAPRAARRPPLDRVLVSQLLATIGAIGGELRGVLGRVGVASLPEADREKLDEALVAVVDARDALMRALQREP